MTTSIAEITLDKRLWGWSEEINTSVKAILFGELVSLAAPIQEHYQSDLYHDALWVNEFVTGPCTFWFSVGPWGTSIDNSEALVAWRRENVWECSLTVSGGEWWLTARLLTTEGAI